MLPARLPGYAPALLDQLCSSGEVIWAGNGALGSDDGWLSLYLADRAGLLRPAPLPVELSAEAAVVGDALRDGGALFFRQVVEAAAQLTQAGSAGFAGSDADVLLALWELVWAGLATNDTLAPVRALTGGAGRRRASPAARRRRGPAFPSRMGPPAAAGRWSLLPPVAGDPTRAAHAAAEQLLARHGVLTRGAVMAERVPGGFAGVYAVLKVFEDAGRCRRGYFVEGLAVPSSPSPGP